MATIELAVKASRRLATKTGSSGVGHKGPNTIKSGQKILAWWNRGAGEAKEVEGWGTLVAVEEDHGGRRGGRGANMPVLILWHVIGAGCMAIWPCGCPQALVSQSQTLGSSNDKLFPGNIL